MADRTLLIRIAAAIALGLLVPRVVQDALAISIVVLSLATGVACIRDPQQVRQLTRTLERILWFFGLPH